MSEHELELPVDLEEFRGDTLLMHAELLELELWRIRREMLSDPGLVKLTIGAGQPVEQTITGNRQDPYNGVAIFNPTPATLSVGFEAGAGILAPTTVPPFTWVAFPERYTNLSVALMNPADQQAIADPVTVLRTRIPPKPAAGPYGVQEAWSELELTIAQPAAAAELSIAVPAGQWWKLESLFFSLVTSAAAGNRYERLAILDLSGNIVWTATPPANLGGTNNRSAQYTRLGPSLVGVPGANASPDASMLPDLWVPPGFVIQTISGLQAGDQYSAARGLYRMATRQPR